MSIDPFAGLAELYKTTSFMEPRLLIVRRDGEGFCSFFHALVSVALSSLAGLYIQVSSS